MCVLFCSSVFLHNSRSDNGRKTSAPAVCRRISVASLTFMAGFPQTGFDTKLVNFFLKLVLPVILKELQSNFLISTIASCDSYASFVLGNLPRASITPWLHAARLPFLNLIRFIFTRANKNLKMMSVAS